MNFCPYCGGKIVSSEAKFCMSCGKSLEAFMNQSQAAPAPKPVPEAKSVDIPEATTYEYSIDAKNKGSVTKICVNTGAVVNRGDVLLTVKNYFSGDEETISADVNAVVKNFAVKVGQTVKPNDTLVVLASSSAPAQDDDFFGEFNEASEALVTETSSSDDFFGELDTASQQEDSAANATILTAEKYFMAGKFQKAESLLRQFVGKNYDRANYMLCVMYEYGGDGIIPNGSKAFELIGDCNEPLTFMHYFNFIMPHNAPRYGEYTEVFSKMLSKWDVGNDPLTKFEVGYYLGNKLNQVNKCINYLRAAEQDGYWLASIYLGILSFDEGNAKEYLRHYVIAADKGIVNAAKLVGSFYKVAPEGTGITQDLRLAKKYLLIAANHNDREAIFHLGDLYNLEGNVREAMRWFEKNVSTNEDPDSASQLGLILLNIPGEPVITTDYLRAFQLFQFALSRNDKDSYALFGMGYSYMAGEAVNADIDTAKRYFNLALQNGNNTGVDVWALQALETLENSQKQNQNSGCFITTAVCENFGKPDDCFELTTFRNFRDGWLIAQPDGKSLIAEYYAVAPRIVANINRTANPAKIYETIREKYLAPCLNFILRGDNLACKKLYVEMVTELKKIYA